MSKTHAADLEKPLSGRVGLVTGGSRGLGLAICQGLAQAGAKVVVASRKLEACRQVADDLSAQYGVETLPVAANVSDWDDCEHLVSACVERFGGVDVLVNNAGLSPLYPSLAEHGQSLFDKVIGVNLKGPFRLTALLGPTMVGRGGGSIINISSAAAIRATPIALPYSAAKAGLEALTVGFAQDLAPTVRVNAIRCGMFATDISRAWGPRAEIDDWAAEAIPLGRLGDPGEIVAAAVYLASDASSYCTGTVITVDGGRSLGLVRDPLETQFRLRRNSSVLDSSPHSS